MCRVSVRPLTGQEEICRGDSGVYGLGYRAQDLGAIYRV